MKIVIFGLSIASSWGNGHATTYRGLVRELHRRGHTVTFYENSPWYDGHVDLPSAEYCEIVRYGAWPPPGAEEVVRDADVVVLGSYALNGIQIAEWLPGKTGALLAYYDIDTPVTLEKFREHGAAEYLRPDQLARFDVVLSFAGGPALDELRGYGARRAEPFYCAVDAEAYRPVPHDPRFQCELGYMGTYAAARQDMVDELLLAPAAQRPEKRFLLAGAQFTDEMKRTWPANVTHLEHVAPPDHAAFFSSCAWQMKALRQEMRRIGWAPSVTIFEVAACGAPLISDRWAGFEDFLAPGREALVADTRDDVLAALELPEAQRRAIGQAGRERILRSHTYVQRVDHLERLLGELGAGGPSAGTAGAAGSGKEPVAA